MIQFEHVSFAYAPDRPALTDVSFAIRDGESVGLIGANGAGKSTLMKVLLGLEPHEGRITVDGIEVTKPNLREIRRRLGFVMQDADNQLFMPTVFEDVVFAPLNYGLSRAEAEARADAALMRLDITELKHRHNHTLSGGEKRMAAIATVLTMTPGALLMDEPTDALDPYNRRRVIETVNGLDTTKLITSHDLDMIWECCARVILLSRGHVVADGSREDILRDRVLLENNRLELPLRFM